MWYAYARNPKKVSNLYDLHLTIFICFSLNEAENTKKMFRKVQNSVAVMVDMFKKSKFFLCVAQKMNYQDGIIFTENNIVSYLAELEEYISSLITYTAFKKDE